MSGPSTSSGGRVVPSQSRDGRPTREELMAIELGEGEDDIVVDDEPSRGGGRSRLSNSKMSSSSLGSLDSSLAPSDASAVAKPALTPADFPEMPSDWFVYKEISENGKSARFSCVRGACKGSNKSFACPPRSRTNMMKHVKAAHARDLTAWVAACAIIDKRNSLARRRWQSGTPTPGGRIDPGDLTDRPESIDEQSSQHPRGRSGQLTLFQTNLFSPRMPQHAFDLLLLKLVVLGSLSIRQAGERAIQEALFQCLGERAQGLRFPNRREIGTLLDVTFDAKKKELKELLSKVSVVATTADGWSSRKRGFLGMTVHLFQPETLVRKSGCLGLRRLRGTHDHQKLARAIFDVHDEFDITHKVSGTTTDNASNFGKSFEVFGEDRKAPVTHDDTGLPVQPGKTPTSASQAVKKFFGGGKKKRKIDDVGELDLSDETGDDDVAEPFDASDSDDDSEDEEGDDDVIEVVDPDVVAQEPANLLRSSAVRTLPKGVKPVEIERVLAGEVTIGGRPSLTGVLKTVVGCGMSAPGLSEYEIDLPKHARCAAHSLNLVATKDASEALKPPTADAEYRSMFVRVTGKLKALCKRQSKSTKAADAVKDRMGRFFVAEVKTRWNSSYNAFKYIAEMSEEKRDIMNSLFAEFKLKPAKFAPLEFIFIEEYVRVMQPIAIALNMLQGEGMESGKNKNLGMGYLVPVIGNLKCAYQDLLETEGSAKLKYCRGLVKAILAGINKRFGAALKDDDLLVAAAVHPKFRLARLSMLSPSERMRVANLVKAKAAELREAKRAQEGGDREQCGTSSTPPGGAIQLQPRGLTPQDPEESFWVRPNVDFVSRSEEDAVNCVIDAWLRQEPIDDVHSLGPLKDLFIKLNTALPSSAPVERLFSVAGHIFIPCRSRLGDKRLEAIVFLRVNYSLLGLEIKSKKT